MMLVTSGWILFAMPKSISFSEAFTMTKLAGFKSLWIIPIQNTHAVVRSDHQLLWHLWHLNNTGSGSQLIVGGTREMNRVCGWCGQPPACSSSRTSSLEGSQFCAFATKCSDPSFHTPSTCRCSCWLFHWKKQTQPTKNTTIRTFIEAEMYTSGKQ